MSLIECPECGKQISDKAKSCPNCGCPIMVGNTSMQTTTIKNADQKVSGLSVVALIFSIIGCTFIIGIVLAIIDLCKKDGRKKVCSKIALIICGFWLIIFFIAFGSSETDSNNSISNTNATVSESKFVITEQEESTKRNEENRSADEGLTTGQKNALASANSYLNYSAFSYQGLIEQLEYEKYSHNDAVFAADNCGADWNEQAAKSAKSYLDYSSFSRDGLIEQLEYEGFTHEQAVYGVEANGY